MVVDERDDPLVKALPPETDYLTYLTILEYQLTRERLPILHNLLQDEKLTVNIGWDLVQLLLPMMPASQECLQDVARLGNPREVILRVCNSLMKLEPVQDEDGDDGGGEDDRRLSEAVGEVKLEEKPHMNEDDENADDKLLAATSNVPVHVLQFNCLLSMLSVLHSRIQTRYPSRFVATSLQAVLEAYTAFPTVETTAAVLEFFRDIAGKKRPRLPPRNTSESILLTQSTPETAAPDPEAESHPGTVGSEESALINRLMQFGLIELLKTYLLHCVNAAPAGMQWALRLQEKLDTRNQMHSSLSFIGAFGKEEYLKERDMTVGKIIALSRDFGIETNELLDIISKPGDQQPPPLDFEETPKHAEDIHLQRHGCLLLLAARSAADKLLSSGQPVKAIPVFPDLAAIYSHFLGEGESPYSVVMEEPEALVDSLCSLAVIASSNPSSSPPNETEFTQFIIQLTACIRAPGFCSFSRMERVPSTIFHSNPDPVVRFNLIRQILEVEDIQYAREPAIGWLKEDLLAATTPNVHPDQKENPFIDPTHFAILFPRIYEPIPDDWLSLGTAKTDHLINTWLTFMQHLLPYHLAILNLYYFLTQSATLYKQLQIQELHPAFESKFLVPLRTFAQQISTDAEIKARVEMEIGNEAEQVGQGAAELMLHIIGEIEDASAGLLVNVGQEGSSN
ncbi:Kinetochor_Ybp2 superfamily protein [Histoplasma ohiense]|nr:Kinetochor_Ybp2 superfamily protein [Histoplasma ohiense (nom. inval.)]